MMVVRGNYQNRSTPHAQTRHRERLQQPNDRMKRGVSKQVLQITLAMLHTAGGRSPYCL